MKNVLMMLVLLSVTLAFNSTAMAIVVLNGSFETVVGANGNVTLNPGSWTNSVGNNMPGSYSDGSTIANLPGWTGNAGASFMYTEGVITGFHNIGMNSWNWGNEAGRYAATTVLSDSIGASDGTAVTISMWAVGNDFPIVFDLLADGVALTPTSSVSPAIDGSVAVEFTRYYDIAKMAAVGGQDLTIQFGLAPNDGFEGGGGQTFFDDVNLTVVPEPTTMALLGLGGLSLIRRRRNG